jgi:hypothetical protein
MDLYAPTAFALEFFASRLEESGVIVVDDYGFSTCPGIKRAVDLFLMEQRNWLSLHLLPGQIFLTKTNAHAPSTQNRSY